LDVNAIDFAETLGVGLYNIEFEKADGTLRQMVCTRSTELIPAEFAPKSARTITESTTAVPVFDVVKQEWRSIRPSFIRTMEAA